MGEEGGEYTTPKAATPGKGKKGGKGKAAAAAAAKAAKEEGEEVQQPVVEETKEEIEGAREAGGDEEMKDAGEPPVADEPTPVKEEEKEEEADEEAKEEAKEEEKEEEKDEEEKDTAEAEGDVEEEKEKTEESKEEEEEKEDAILEEAAPALQEEKEGKPDGKNEGGEEEKKEGTTEEKEEEGKAAEKEEPNDGEVDGSLDPDMALIASLAEAAGEAPADEDEHPQEESQIVGGVAIEASKLEEMVTSHGGLERVNEGRLWTTVARAMGIDAKKFASAGTYLKRMYLAHTGQMPVPGAGSSTQQHGGADAVAGETEGGGEAIKEEEEEGDEMEEDKEEGGGGQGEGKIDRDAVQLLCGLSEAKDENEEQGVGGGGLKFEGMDESTTPVAESETSLTPRRWGASEDGGDGGGRTESDGRPKTGGKKGKKHGAGGVELKPTQTMSRDERKMLFYMKQFEKMEQKNNPSTPRGAGSGCDEGAEPGTPTGTEGAPVSHKKRKEGESDLKMSLDKVVAKGFVERAASGSETPPVAKKPRSDEEGSATTAPDGGGAATGKKSIKGKAAQATPVRKSWRQILAAERVAGGGLSVLRDLKVTMKARYRPPSVGEAQERRDGKKCSAIKVRRVKPGDAFSEVPSEYKHLGIVAMSCWRAPPGYDRMNANRRDKVPCPPCKKGVVRWLERLQADKVAEEEAKKKEEREKEEAEERREREREEAEKRVAAGDHDQAGGEAVDEADIDMDVDSDGEQHAHSSSAKALSGTGGANSGAGRGSGDGAAGAAASSQSGPRSGSSLPSVPRRMQTGGAAATLPGGAPSPGALLGGGLQPPLKALSVSPGGISGLGGLHGQHRNLKDTLMHINQGQRPVQVGAYQSHGSQMGISQMPTAPFSGWMQRFGDRSIHQHQAIQPPLPPTPHHQQLQQQLQQQQQQQQQLQQQQQQQQQLQQQQQQQQQQEQQQQQQHQQPPPPTTRPPLSSLRHPRTLPLPLPIPSTRREMRQRAAKRRWEEEQEVEAEEGGSVAISVATGADLIGREEQEGGQGVGLRAQDVTGATAYCLGVRLDVTGRVLGTSRLG